MIQANQGKSMINSANKSTVIEDIDAEKLAIAARESISRYCYSECKAYCCRKGFLLLNEKEVSLMKDTHKEDLKIVSIPNESAHAESGEKKYVFDLGLRTDGCPNLQDYKRTIHKNPARPKTCKEFPLFIWKNKTVMVTNACPAVKENKLYSYLAEFKKRGYNLIYAEGKEGN